MPVLWPKGTVESLKMITLWSRSKTGGRSHCNTRRNIFGSHLRWFHPCKQNKRGRADFRHSPRPAGPRPTLGSNPSWRCSWSHSKGYGAARRAQKSRTEAAKSPLSPRDPPTLSAHEVYTDTLRWTQNEENFRQTLVFFSVKPPRFSVRWNLWKISWWIFPIKTWLILLPRKIDWENTPRIFTERKWFIFYP